ncbi:Uncharacterised protein g8758 [Pycnogonum litorale]
MALTSNVMSSCVLNRIRIFPAYNHFKSILCGYKSAISLDKIYPNSSLNIASHISPEKLLPKSDEDEFSGYIPIGKLKITYSRGSGPGGQHVNKVNTKVDVRFHVASAEWIPQKLRLKLIEKHKNTITKDGILFVKSDKTRSQLLNQADCMDKLRTLIRKLSESEKASPPLTEEQHAIEQARADRETAMRLRQKRERSLIKQHRQSPSDDF